MKTMRALFVLLLICSSILFVSCSATLLVSGAA